MAELKNTIVNGVLNVNGDLIASKIIKRGDTGSILRGDGSTIATGSNGQFLSISNGVPTWVSPTKSSVGLGNVDNTADANKIVNKANLLNPHQNVSSTDKSGWDPTNSGKVIWGQRFINNSIGTDSGDLTLFLRGSQYSSGGTELCMNIDGDYYSSGKKVINSGGGSLTGNLNPATNKGASLGTSSLYWNNIYGTTIYENGTALSSKYLGINDTAKTATNLVSFTHNYHRPTANGGDGKQWMRILNFVDNDIANGNRWYGKAVDIEFYNNGYGSSGNYTYMGHVSLCIVVQNHGSFVNESVTIKWRDCKPDIWAPARIKAVKNANSVEIFMLNDIWDTAITGVIVRNQGLDVAASSTCYTKEEFNTYVNGKSVVTGIIDTNLAIGRLDNYTKKTITIPNNTNLDTVTESGFYRLSVQTNTDFSHGQMIECKGEDTAAQLVFPYDSTKMYVRTGNPFNTSGGLWHDWKQVAFTDHTHTSINTAFVFNNNDMPEGSANLAGTTTAHKLTFYRNGLSVPYQMDDSNDGGILRCRGNSESNTIFELATWDDYGTGETIQFNYYPPTSQATPTYSVTVPKKTGTILLTTDSSSAGNAEADKVVARNDAGSIQTEKLAVSSGTTTKATMQYNSTNDCIEFIFA